MKFNDNNEIYLFANSTKVVNRCSCGILQLSSKLWYSAASVNSKLSVIKGNILKAQDSEHQTVNLNY